MIGGAWAIQLDNQRASAAAALRLRPGILVGSHEDSVWLRGEKLDEALERELRKLPGAQRFAVQADGALIPDGARLPRGKLPEVDWQPVSAWFSLAPQPAALAGELRRRAALRLVRTGREESASVLLTPWAEWQAYALSASALRLRPLRFAVRNDGRTLLRGTPLPPLLGRRYAEHGGIAVPCGWSLAPGLDPPIIRELLGIPAADLALFKNDVSWEWIRAEQFVSATRSSVRATKETLPTSLQ